MKRQELESKMPSKDKSLVDSECPSTARLNAAAASESSARSLDSEIAKTAKPSNIKRREALIKLSQNAGFALFGALAWGAYINVAKASSGHFLRPPGASELDSEFVASCIKCGLCVEACPFYTLRLAKPEDGPMIGTPFFTPRKVPCYMCKDIPCARECPTDALSLTRLAKVAKASPSSESSDDFGLLDSENPESKRLDSEKKEPDINNATMGVAVVDAKHCIAYAGIQCDACYRACPLIDKAISLEYKQNERTGKHGFLLPVVDSDYCTGCGMCEKACITELPTIIVLPRHAVLGKMGTNYIKGWDKDDESRLYELDSESSPKGGKKEPKKQKDSLDYLNLGDF